jgi:NAD(P)-dependent dehydrogenase (short-subunit alcohol dehydrogenase family)
MRLANSLARENVLQGTGGPFGAAVFRQADHELVAVPERKAVRLREIALQRFGEPEEIVGLALFLASEAGSFVTGEIIRVDGGQTI